MIIYADELFLNNFLMSFFILLVVSKILNIKHRGKDLILASIISSLITIFVVIYEAENNFFVRMLTIVVTNYIAFQEKKIEKILIEITFVLGITFFIGGVLSSSIKSIFEIIICMLVFIISCKKYTQFLKQKKWRARNAYDLSFKIEKENIEAKVFIDTGNTLETKYGEPVIIIYESKLPKNIIQLLKSGKLKNKRRIMYRMINEETKTTYGLKVENIKIKNDECEIVRDAVIMLSKNKINESDGIIGINLLEGGMNSGDTFNFKTKSKEVIC